MAMTIGSKGNDVKQVQETLISIGYSLPNYGADGSFGSETAGAVAYFQNDYGLPANGIVDPDTWKYMYEALQGTRSQVRTTVSRNLTSSRVAPSIIPSGIMELLNRRVMGISVMNWALVSGLAITMMMFKRKPQRA